MKYLLPLFLIAAIALANIPAYESGQYYVYDSPSVASNALKYINVDSGWLPFVSTNSNYRMNEWVKNVEYRADGKAVIPRIPDRVLAYYGVSTNQAALFFQGFPCTIEKVTTNWFPEVDE